MNKKVSIIVPAFNAEKFINRSIDSIINQTYKDLEIIIIDDYSTDKTKDIIKKYASLDSRIRPFYSEINQGVSKSRNIGLKCALGDYILFVDADDKLDEDAVEKLVDAAIKYDSDLVDYYHLVVYNDGKKELKFTEKKVPSEVLVMGCLKDNIEILDKATYITGKLISKKLIGDTLFDESLRKYEDLVFEHELKLKLKNMVFLNEVLYTYYQVPGSLINSLGEKHVAFLDAAKEVIEVYKDSSDEIKLKIESLLVTNAFLTGVTKVVKNDKSLDENTELLYNYMNSFDKVFPTWRNNKYLSKMIKRMINKYINNKKRINKLIKRTRKKDFINKYFKVLSIMNKYNK